MEETWLPVKGFEGSYTVSNKGMVKSLCRPKDSGKGGTQLVRECIKKPTDNGHGYLAVMLYRDNHHNRKYVHRLVAESFLANPDNLPEVNHIDGSKNNNAVTNLEWVTGSNNKKHAFINGLNRQKRGLDNPHSRPVNQLSLSGDLIKQWPSISVAARALAINGGTISGVLCGKGRTAGGFRWKAA